MSAASIDLAHAGDERRRRQRQQKTAPWVIIVIALGAAAATRLPQANTPPPPSLVPTSAPGNAIPLLPQTSGPASRCNTVAVSGQNIPETRVIEMGRNAGTFTLSYNTYTVPDRIVVSYEDSVLFDSQCVGESLTKKLSYSGASTQVTVNVMPNCTGTISTGWDFTIGCPE